MTEIALILADQEKAKMLFTLVFIAIIATPILLIILIIGVVYRRGSKEE